MNKYIFIHTIYQYRCNILYVEHLIGWAVEPVYPPSSDGFLLGIVRVNCRRTESDSTCLYQIVWPFAGVGSSKFEM